MDVATSVISLVTTAATICSTLRKYGSNVKDARSDINVLYNEISALQNVLEKTVQLVNNPNASKFSTLALLNENNGPAEKCAMRLVEIQSKLHPQGMSRTGWRALSWPFKSAKVKETVGELERYKSAFILALSADQTTMTVSIDSGVTSLREDFAMARLDDAEERQRDKLEAVRREAIGWLSTTDPSINHLEQRRKHEPTTGDWFVQGRDLSDWRETPNSFFWLHGTSGCGKTVLSSTIIEHIKDDYLQPECALVYYYFDFNDPKKRKVDSFVASLVSQLCCQLPFLPDRLRDLWLECHEGRQRPLLVKLMRELNCLLADFTDVFLVVDALDECPEDNGERGTLLEIITEIHSWQAEHLHVLATSRQQTDIEVMLEPLLTAKAISIRDEQVNADVRILVSHEVGTIARKNRWPPILKTEVEEALVLGSNGMLRWVSCQLDSLRPCLKPSLVRQKLRSLPRDLEETYARTLLNINEDYREDACIALRWLTFSERPLELNELIEALLVVPGKDPPYNPEDRLPDPYLILQYFPGLVSVSEIKGSETSPEVRLAHASVKDFLVSPKILQGPTAPFGTSIPTANQFITESCLAYILQYDTAQDRTNSPADLANWPLLAYASKYWYIHKRAFSENEGSRTPTSPRAGADALLLRLLVSDSNTQSWLQVHRPDMTWRQPFDRDDSEHDLGSALYYASCMGFREAVRRLVDKGGDPNTEGGFYGSPLRAAAHYGHEKTCLLLLQRGARIEDTDINGSAALWYAADGGHEGVVRLLIENDAELERGSGEGIGTALYAGASNRHFGVVKTLIKHGAQVDAATKFRKTALRGAAMNGDLETVNLLLDHGATVDMADTDGQTPLVRAAVNGKETAIALLLERGADIEARDVRGQTALSWGAYHGHVDVLKVLLDSGADKESKNDEGQTALHRAAASGRELAVKILLERGADAKVEDMAWLTPGEWAMQNGHLDVVHVLGSVDRG